MKTIITLCLTILLVSNLLVGQDTLYIYQSGQVVSKRAITDIDSIVFYNTVKDVDNNVYKTITIGNQIWMAENLKTTKYKNGTAIPKVTDAMVWSGLTTPAYCWYNNDSSTYYTNKYGALYNWYTVNTGNLCPTGWHVPTNAEWTTLITYLGGENITGGRLKENGTTHWYSPNTEATNEKGFTALPAGWRNDGSSSFYFVGYGTLWWSDTQNGVNSALRIGISNDSDNVFRSDETFQFGLSVRCVKD